MLDPSEFKIFIIVCAYNIAAVAIFGIFAAAFWCRGTKARQFFLIAPRALNNSIFKKIIIFSSCFRMQTKIKVL